MDDAEIAAELEAIRERLAELARALAARAAVGAPADEEAHRTISRITTEELDALTNEELRRISEEPR